VIDDKVGNVLAKALLEDKIKRGEKITINPENFEIEKL
jgi:ATP-dependent Clp protease ATP-binding subunit ClpA